MDTSAFDDVQYRLNEIKDSVMQNPDHDIRRQVVELIRAVQDAISITIDKLHEAANK